MDTAPVTALVLDWYEDNARDLPWRRPEATPWQIMISEFMLQQTPVARVLQPWREWVARWPTPGALAAEPVGEAVRAWGRLGYPRRAVRLHRAAVAIAHDYDDHVPAERSELAGLPGVGSYTVAAILSFAFRQRHVVLDTNVRRVLARAVVGEAFPPPSTTVREVDLATEMLPESPPVAARWAAASMELGALVCTARSPRCGDCPIRTQCRWRASGFPAWTGPPRRGQSYTGTDRQCRGALLGVLRSSMAPVTRDRLDLAWPDPAQCERALASLVEDGLAEPVGECSFALPG